MECPKCHKAVSQSDKTCPNCGTRLKSDDDIYAARRKRISDKGSVIDVTPSKGGSSLKKGSGAAVKKGAFSQFSEGKAKIIAAAGAAVLFVVLIIIIVMTISGSKGEKKATKIAEYIGVAPEVAESKLDTEFKKQSAFNVLNNAVDFDYIIESEDDMSSGGITYPKWAVFIKKNKNNKIKSVRYVDFKTIEDDIDGEKRDKLVNLDKYNAGVDIENITDVLGEDIYAKTYTKDSVVYTYRYWFKNDKGDRQPVILDIIADTDGKYVSYESRYVYPSNL